MPRRPRGKKSPAPSEARDLRLRSPRKRKDWVAQRLIFLASLQQTKALTSQPIQLTHPAVLILLRNDLQKRTGQGSVLSQSRCRQYPPG